VSQTQHELHVINDARDQHQNAEGDERNAEITSRPFTGDSAQLSQFFECLCDRKTEADQR
jgi:hypothetical protein